MNLLMIPLIGLPALAVLYLLMIMPRMAGKPDTAPFQKWLYAHRGLHSNEPAQRGEDMEIGRASCRERV